MKKLLVMLIVFLTAIIFTKPASATEIFSDNFNDNSFNTAKWSKVIQSNGGPLGTIDETGGQLLFNLQGGNPGGSAYAKSTTFSALSGWTDISFTGLWGMNAYTAGTQIYIFNGNDPSKYFLADYSPYWHTLSLYDSGNLGGSFTRSNSSSTPFAIHLTPTGVEFSENGTRWGNFYNSTSMQGANSFYVQIGGGDYWVNDGFEYASFDDIQVDCKVVPEPASLSFLGLGLFGLVGLRRKKY